MLGSPAAFGCVAAVNFCPSRQRRPSSSSALSFPRLDQLLCSDLRQTDDSIMATNGQAAGLDGHTMNGVDGHAVEGRCAAVSDAKGDRGRAVAREWNVRPSVAALSTKNPIRQLVEVMKLVPNPHKDVIRLTIGDPTIYNLLPPKHCTDAVHQAVESTKHHGYPNSVGLLEGREAVAKYFDHPLAPLTADDVILTSGCSHALELVIRLLTNPGENILIPMPGFSIYKVICGNAGLQCKYYDLLPEKQWEVDLDHMESQIDENTKAIVTNTPANPCGSVFSREHMEQIVAIAEKYRLPIIADEVYERVVFRGHEHVSFASVSRAVPVFTVGALSKRFVAPGWRMGWLLVQDPSRVLGPELRRSLVALTQVILGPSSLLQGALPHILTHDSDDQLDEYNRLYERNARTIFSSLSSTPGLQPIMPSGAMYMMVRVDLSCFHGIANTVEFTEKLMAEESVFCLPTECFDFPGYLRLVLAVQEEKVLEACKRIQEFCEHHAVKGSAVKKHLLNGSHA